MEQPQPNPFQPAVESTAASFDVRRQELSPHVRSYVDTLYVQIRQIFDKYGVANIEDLRDGVKEKKIRMHRTDGERLKDLTRWLRDTLKEREVPRDYQEKTREYVLFHIPVWDDMVSEFILKDQTVGYKFDEVRQEFRDGRRMSEFHLTDRDLRSDGIKGENQRKILLERLAMARKPKTSAVGKLFSIRDLIAQKKAEDSNHPNLIKSLDIWIALNAAGYRPATLEELLSFAKYHWQPEVVGKDDFGHNVFALGSGLTEPRAHHRCMPYLTVMHGKRQLFVSPRETGWGDAVDSAILAVKKD